MSARPHRRHERLLRRGLAEGLPLKEIARRSKMGIAELRAACQRLGIDIGDGVAFAPPPKEETDPPDFAFREREFTPAQLAQRCAEHFRDLAAGYPGRKLSSLKIPEGYARRLTHAYADVETRSIAADCAEAGE